MASLNIGPRIEVTVDGHPVAGTFYERLISITVTDKQEAAADTVDIELNDDPQMAIPRKGAIIDVRLGYGALRSLGRFTVDKVTCNCLPFKMSISGKSADFKTGKMKDRKERHWDKKKVKDIVSEIASEIGLSASVDSEIGDHEYEWIAQQDETNGAFLQRLADRHNALFSIKSGKVIFAKRGSGNAASGAFVGSVVVHPEIIIQGTCSFETNDVRKYKKVVAYYQDKDQAERVEVDADANADDADADAVYRIHEPFGSIEEADKAAQSKARDIKRGESTVSVTVIGDTGICAGAPLLFQGVRAGLDGAPYIIKTATHTLSKSEGYRTQISAKLYDGKSSSEGKKSAANDNGKANSDSDKTAPNSPAGTPATPSEWQQFKRNGSTDSN